MRPTGPTMAYEGAMLADLETIKADVLVVGAGVAGLLAAIKAREFVDKVVLVDKAKVARSGCSPFAAGIYDSFMPGDDLNLWVRELVEAGEYLNDQEWTRQHVEQTYTIVTLVDAWAKQRGWEVFEKDSEGNFIRKKSRGHVHTAHLVFNALNWMDTLKAKAQDSKVIFVERTMVTDIVTDEQGGVSGALGLEYRKEKLYLFEARAVVLAAGGCGFKSIFLGHKNLTGDLQAAAYLAGAVMRNMEFSSSNTCHKDFDIHGLNLFVHVGGKFLNSAREDFMWKYRPDLGPRARRQDLCLAFCQEVKAGRGPIHLDMRAANEENQRLCRKILPETFRAWERAGVDPFKEPMPWVPAFYGTLSTSGGIEIDLRGATSIEGLYAAGDVACAPANGTGGPGGSAFAFASVSGYLAGEHAARYAAGQARQAEVSVSQAKEKAGQATSVLGRSSGISSDVVLGRLQKLLFPYPVSYLKTKEALSKSLAGLGELNGLSRKVRAVDGHELVRALELRNMLVIAELFLRASLFREESRGFHFRQDFPRTDNVNWLKWLCVQKEGEETKFWTRDIPTPHLKPQKELDHPPGIMAPAGV